jgi:endoglucanase
MSRAQRRNRRNWYMLAVAIAATVPLLATVSCISRSSTANSALDHHPVSPPGSPARGASAQTGGAEPGLGTKDGTPASATRTPPGDPGSPPGSPGLYTDPGNPLFSAAAQLKAEGQQAEAAAVQAVAGTPSGIWAAGQPGDIQHVRAATEAAAKAHSIPVIVVYNLPDRDACGKFSADAGAAAGYESWIKQLAGAIGSGDDIVVVEPDGLPDIVRGCLSPSVAAQRYQLLSYAMKALGALPHAQVYLDAGNPGMFSNPAQLTGPLEQAGVRYGRGFSANVSNFEWTDNVVTWSRELEQSLGGQTGAVVDTSRNGLGPYTGPQTPQWCNPPGRAVGPEPTLHTGASGIDGYLWIKDPGASDGLCNGGPPAGQIWPQYAAALWQAAHSHHH